MKKLICAALFAFLFASVPAVQAIDALEAHGSQVLPKHQPTHVSHVKKNSKKAHHHSGKKGKKKTANAKA